MTWKKWKTDIPSLYPLDVVHGRLPNSPAVRRPMLLYPRRQCVPAFSHHANLHQAGSGWALRTRVRPKARRRRRRRCESVRRSRSSVRTPTQHDVSPKSGRIRSSMFYLSNSTHNTPIPACILSQTTSASFACPHTASNQVVLVVSVLSCLASLVAGGSQRGMRWVVRVVRVF